MHKKLTLFQEIWVDSGKYLRFSFKLDCWFFVIADFLFLFFFTFDVGVNGNSGRRLFRKWRGQCNFHRTQIVPNE